MEGADPDSIDVAKMGTNAFIRVSGRGSFKNSPALKRFCLDSYERGSRRFVIDMAGCLGMDSTFMGVVSGLACRFNEGEQKSILMVNLNAENHELLETLGVSLIIDTFEEAASQEILQQFCPQTDDLAGLECGDGTDRLTIETMLSAHRELCDVSDANTAKFENVIEYLEQKIADLDGADTES